MHIPENIRRNIEASADVMENNYFAHAVSALKALNAVTEDTYCYDHVSMAINTLERTYKGFLKAAAKECEWYQLPYYDFLEKDHDILKIVKEIKKNFPDCLPRQDRDDWQMTKNFLRDLRLEYSRARYDSYPLYSEFDTLRKYVANQFDIVEKYIRDDRLLQNYEEKIREDY